MNSFRVSTLVVMLAALPVVSGAQTIQVNKENRTIAITATDKVTAMADQATLHLGFIAYGPDSNTAYANGSRVSNSTPNCFANFAISALECATCRCGNT